MGGFLIAIQRSDEESQLRSGTEQPDRPHLSDINAAKIEELQKKNNMEEIRLNAHAKVNLSLEITGKRPDGYHEIVSFMQGTGLHDVVKIKKCSQKATKYNLPHCTINGIVVYLCTDTKTIPADMSNLAFKGVRAFADAYEAAGLPADKIPEALLIDIQKKLPVAAGIAGGSGNGAAAMLGLNAILGHPFTLRELMRIGTAIGADVPFSLFMNAYRSRDALAGLRGIEEARDSAWTSGIGDIVEGAEPVHRHVILANPGVAVSTKAAYEAMDSIGYGNAENREHRLFVNDLEKYTLAEQPAAAELKSLMLEELAADEVLMSGSGPTIAAYYKDAGRAAAGMEALSAHIRPESRISAWLTETGR